MYKDIESDLFKIFAKVFGLMDNSINMGTSQENLENWDSLNHILLIVEVEKKFNIKFKVGEISELNSVKKIFERILYYNKKD
jgi:acyl carrier protein